MVSPVAVVHSKALAVNIGAGGRGVDHGMLLQEGQAGCGWTVVAPQVKEKHMGPEYLREEMVLPAGETGHGQRCEGNCLSLPIFTIS